jgi:hypothetical protein
MDKKPLSGQLDALFDQLADELAARVQQRVHNAETQPFHPEQSARPQAAHYPQPDPSQTLRIHNPAQAQYQQPSAPAQHQRPPVSGAPFAQHQPVAGLQPSSFQQQKPPLGNFEHDEPVEGVEFSRFEEQKPFELPVGPEPQTNRFQNRALHTEFIRRFTIILILAVIAINLPYNVHGTALARSITSVNSIVFRDGLLVRETGSEQIWLYQDHAFRHVTSLEAFNHYKLRWDQVREVEAGFLADYPTGKPLYLLFRCTDASRVYLVANSKRHWIYDLAAFKAHNFEWSEVANTCYHYNSSTVTRGEDIYADTDLAELLK